MHSYQSLMHLTPFLKTCNFYRHVCNEVAGALLSPSLVLALYNLVHTGKKNSYLQFYKPGTLCKPHSILVSLRTHLEIFNNLNTQGRNCLRLASDGDKALLCTHPYLSFHLFRGLIALKNGSQAWQMGIPTGSPFRKICLGQHTFWSQMSQDHRATNMLPGHDMYLLCLADLLKVQPQNTVSLYRRKLFSSFSSKNKSTALRYSQVLRYIESFWFSDGSEMGFVIKWLRGWV